MDSLQGLKKEKFLKNQCYVRIQHIKTQKSLHSHQIKYKYGSGQFEVTCYHESDDNDLWQVYTDGEDNQKIKNNDRIRLEHVKTGNFLHSHKNHKSPSSSQQEVTCFWERDENDYWKLEIADVHNFWELNQPFRLIHIPTNNVLHSHSNHKTSSGQQEVTCFSSRDDNDLWKVVYIGVAL